MSIFRIKKDKNYTCMSNHHLRNANISLKAIGLLSVILSIFYQCPTITRSQFRGLRIP